MYDELVKMLRVCGDSNNSCGNCPARENDGSCPHGEWEFAAEKYMLQAADAIEELSVVVRAQKAVLDKFPKWIPVKEQLPDGRDSVLALTGDCDIYVCDYIPSVKQFWTIPGDELHIDDITHWMPLPQPPKEEGE